jgi:hypothetical protein
VIAGLGAVRLCRGTLRKASGSPVTTSLFEAAPQMSSEA